MSFMQKQITNKQNWLRVETSQGTEFVNTFDLSLFVRDSSTKVIACCRGLRKTHKKYRWQYELQG